MYSLAPGVNGKAVFYPANSRSSDDRLGRHFRHLPRNGFSVTAGLGPIDWQFVADSRRPGVRLLRLDGTRLEHAESKKASEYGGK